MENDFERLLELTEENNKMLKKMRKEQIFSRWLKIIYWIIIILIALGAYYFLQPYISNFNKNIQNFQSAISGFSSTTNNLPSNIPSILEIKQFLEDFKF